MNSLPLTENGFDQVNSETVVCNGFFDDIPAGTAVESEDWRRFFNNGSLGLLKICVFSLSLLKGGGVSGRFWNPKQNLE